MIPSTLSCNDDDGVLQPGDAGGVIHMWPPGVFNFYNVTS